MPEKKSPLIKSYEKHDCTYLINFLGIMSKFQKRVVDIYYTYLYNILVYYLGNLRNKRNINNIFTLSNRYG